MVRTVRRRSADRTADAVLNAIAYYVEHFEPRSALAWKTAHACLLDSLGCAFEALTDPECMKLIGPCVPGTRVPDGARVHGTGYQLDPVEATFCTGALVRWVDYSDAYFGATVMHPSDSFRRHHAHQDVAVGIQETAWPRWCRARACI